MSDRYEPKKIIQGNGYVFVESYDEENLTIEFNRPDKSTFYVLDKRTAAALVEQLEIVRIQRLLDEARSK